MTKKNLQNTTPIVPIVPIVEIVKQKRGRKPKNPLVNTNISKQPQIVAENNIVYFDGK